MILHILQERYVYVIELTPKNVPVSIPQKNVEAANICINERIGFIVALIFLANIRYSVAARNRNNP